MASKRPSIQKRFARVLNVIGASSRLRRGAQLQGLTLADVARDIPTFRLFRQLCAADLLDCWFNDRDTGVRSVHHRKETWLRLYRHWYARLGASGDPPAIRITALDNSGFYTITPDTERRSADDHWRRLMAAGRALNIPDAVLEAFRSANEHYSEKAEIAGASPNTVENAGRSVSTRQCAKPFEAQAAAPQHTAGSLHAQLNGQPIKKPLATRTEPK